MLILKIRVLCSKCFLQIKLIQQQSGNNIATLYLLILSCSSESHWDSNKKKKNRIAHQNSGALLSGVSAVIINANIQQKLLSYLWKINIWLYMPLVTSTTTCLIRLFFFHKTKLRLPTEELGTNYFIEKFSTLQEWGKKASTNKWDSKNKCCRTSLI